MSETRIKNRWVEWNLLGKGKDHSPLYHSKYAYRGPVLYAHEWPVGRLVHATKRNFVCLYKSMGYVDIGKLEKGWSSSWPVLTANLYVEDIGVFSKYPDDMIDEVALHERCREMFLKEAAYLVEQAGDAPDSVLVNSGRYYGRNGQQLIEQMKKLPTRYATYAEAFGLKWKDFPPIYLQTLRSLVERRTERYLSEAEVAKRERKVAREEAKRALGLIE